VLTVTDLHLWIAFAQSAAERSRIEYYLTGDHVDGVLLLAPHHSDPLPRILTDRGLPTVVGGRSLTPDGSAPARPVPDLVSYVDIDDVGGARQAVRYLLAGGRRRIATIAAPQQIGTGVARLTGYRQALAQARIPYDPSLVVQGDLSDGSGEAAMRGLLERRPDLDAVFVASDSMAAGALRTLRTYRRRVPEEVAVIGFEDTAFTPHVAPMLTTVYVPHEELGRQMAQLLVDRIGGEPPLEITLDTQLIRRTSA
jgi:DNA-binding LacI/PurR family transcriptional regulator